MHVRSDTDAVRNGTADPFRAELVSLLVMTANAEAALARARAGDEEAFRDLTDPHRRELHLHCYRILGTMQDAEDAVQETLLAAWRSLEAFEGRASVRTWLYQIATNRCLNALRARSRRPQEVPAMAAAARAHTLDRAGLARALPRRPLRGHPGPHTGPSTRYEARESSELAFIVALQHLPPRQRAALVLRDVLGFRTAEVAEMLDTGEASVKGACSALGRRSKRGCRPPTATGRHGRTPPASGSSPGALPTPSKAATLTTRRPAHRRRPADDAAPAARVPRA